jgi:hypothetical protein
MTPVSQLVTALQQELAQLETELKADPRYRKATRIRELLADYVDQAQPQALAAQSQTTSAQSSTTLSLRETGRRLSKKALIKNEIEQLLLSEGPKHRKQILEILQSKGLMGHEKNPMQALATVLSGFSEDFVNDGSGIWSIREPMRVRTRRPPPEQAHSP